jgi:type IX secretion system PorP/SprF family membrane protein
MKKYFFSILLSFSSIIAMGQIFPLSDHYLTDALDINPAFAGAHNALSASLMYRNQWAGFRDAPKNYMLSVHAPIKNDRIGLGFLVERNTVGIYKETSIMGNYAYRMKVRGGRLALGLGFGVTVRNVAWNELIPADPDDVQLLDTQVASYLPEFSFGGYYYNKNFYLGLSIPLFLNHEEDVKTGKYKTASNFSGSNYFLNSGYSFELSHYLKLKPSILVRYHPGNSVQVDLNTLVDLRDKIMMGVGYRTNNTLVGLLQFHINYQLSLAYSYDYSIGSLGNYMNGSHEIVLNYKFIYRRFVKGPRQF